VPGGGGRSVLLEYQATVSSGSLTIQVENPQGQVVWQAAPPAGPAGNHASQVIALNQGGNYTVVLQGRDAVGSLDLSWKNVK
jgi:hypothetical protein